MFAMAQTSYVPFMSDLPSLVSFTKVSTSVASPQWRLTFSEPVTGVRAQDVRLTGSGSYFTGASVAGLVNEGDGSTWLLTVTSGVGDGSMQPSFTGTLVRDLSGNPLAGRYLQSSSFEVPANVPLVVLDANGDGRPDIATGDSLRFGLGDGGFSGPAALAGGIQGGVPLIIQGNGDARPDLVVAGVTGGFLAGQPIGFASAVPLDLGGAARALLAADVNGDGLQDVVVVPDSGAVRVALQQPAGGFAAAAVTGITPGSASPQSVAAGDINGDGRADLAVFEGDSVRFWLGQADGGFLAGDAHAIGLNRSGIALADFNNDGRLDLLTQGLNISVRLGDGLGGFGERLESSTRVSDVLQPTRSPFPSYSVQRELPVHVIRDVTDDGIPDLVGIAHMTMFFWGTYYLDEAFVTPGRGDGTFGPPVSQLDQNAGLGEFRAYVDFNNDGRTDFLTVRPPQTGQGNTTLKWAVSMAELPLTYGNEATFYTSPRLLSVTVDSPNATLNRHDEAVLTLHFDRDVQVHSDTFLHLSNGGMARWIAGGSASEGRFSYRAQESEISRDVEIAAINGRVVGPGGLEADLSQPGSLPGQLKVATKSALYFANSDGRLAVWAMDGLSVFDKVALSASGGSQALAVVHGTGGDAIFYRPGNLASVASTSPPALGASIGIADSRWSFVGEGGSGGLSPRVFWHSNLGELVFWDASGSSSSPRAWLGQASLDWRVAAIADTTGDGAADIIFQNQDGRVALWQVEGSASTHRAIIDIVTPDWKLVAAGDLNGDGRADLLYRNSADNRLVARFLDGFAGIGDNQVIGVASSDWSIADLRDMNGDGREDILWRNPSGDFAVWTMDGTTILSQQLFDDVSADWQLLG